MEGGTSAAVSSNGSNPEPRNRQWTATDGRECDEGVGAAASGKVKVSLFDYSVENHFRAMEAIAKLCGGDKFDVSLEDREVIRLSSAITFLREWRHFKYEPRVIKFDDSVKSDGKMSPAIKVTLPQFSAAAVPKDAEVFDEAGRTNFSKDYVMHVGGPIWALDWCPRDSGGPECQFKEEVFSKGLGFLVMIVGGALRNKEPNANSDVSAHPSGSSYHKLGSPLTGRGAIQIWSLVTVTANEGEISSVDDRGRKRRNSQALKDKSTKPKRPRGRPRKKPVEKPPDFLDGVGEFVETLSIQLPEDMPQSASPNGTSDDVMPSAVLRDLCRKKRKSQRLKGINNHLLEAYVGSCDSGSQEERSLSVKTDDVVVSFPNQQNYCIFTQQPSAMNDADDSCSLGIGSGCEIAMDVAIPRLVFCLAHNGKVAWDAKWRPSNMNLKKCKHQMGYLAVLLGNGSLEVWEVPLPQTVRAIYSSVCREGTDPRILKLEPVFRCGMIRSGEIQSLPLAVEWSASNSQEYLLVGCHDGTVALWKFSASDQSKDTRPLLCFTADKFPIRSVAWAPHESDPEAANVVVTAGHGGIKFWDIRDPFRPLWDLHSFPHHVLGLDWVPDPRCITFAFDDGTLKFISLSKAANDRPVTGKPFGATKGFLHSYSCSSFAMWSLHVSRYTGTVAYCTADGSVLCFQLTTKAVEKESLRYRTPHFMCVSMAEEKPAIVLNMSASDVPITRKKSLHSEETAVVIYDDRRGENQQTPDSEDKPLALCYGNDPPQVPELEETLSSLKKKVTAKSKNMDNRTQEADLALVCRDQGPENNTPSGENKGDPGPPFDTLPPKIVAMHRVRWNVNRDGARWLCSGGAAGIVRCQEIILPSADKK